VTRASAEGERAPEAGSRWRKPRAREQRHRWRAPRDPTRRRESVMRARGREHSSMEGALARQERSPLTRRRRWPGRATRGDGDSAAMPGPPRVAARGRQRSCRELGARSNTPRPGGAAQKEPRSGLRPRIALCHTRERPGPRPRASPQGAPSGDHVMVVAEAEAGGSPSSEAPPGRLVRQAEVRLPSLAAVGLRPRVSRHPNRGTPQGGARSGVHPGIE
jgi:hypothetical protein